MPKSTTNIKFVKLFWVEIYDKPYFKHKTISEC